MHLPLYFYPVSCVFIDDDMNLLNAITSSLPSHYFVKTYSSANKFIDDARSVNFNASLNFLKANKQDEQFGSINSRSVIFDLTEIAKLANIQNKHHEIAAIVVDYNMPEMTGIELSRRCRFITANRALLTGTAEEEKIISGFNDNLIQKYIRKGTRDFLNELINALDALIFNYFIKRSESILQYLEVEHRTPLSDPIFSNYFLQHCKKNHIVEYYLLDKQGSFLCIDQYQKKSYFIVHTDRSAEEWFTVYGEEETLSSKIKLAFENREKIPFFGVGKEAWQIESDQWNQCFYDAGMLKGRENYYWTVV